MNKTVPNRSSRLIRPKLHEGVWAYRPHVDDLENGVLLFGQSAHALDVVYYKELVPLLDGSLTSEQLVTQLAGIITEEDVKSCLDMLAQRQLIHDAELSCSAGRSLDKLKINLQALGGLSTEVLVDIFHRKGASITEKSDQAELTVVLTDHYLRPELELFNQRATHPWILIGPNGHDMWIGPLFTPGHTACWDCLAHRLRINRKVEQYVWEESGQPQIPQAQSELAKNLAPVAFEMLAEQIVRWRFNARELMLSEQLMVLDSKTLSNKRHPVSRRPQCSSCGSAVLDDPQPIRLPSLSSSEASEIGTSLNTTRQSDAHRDIEANRTLKRYANHISPITGLVTQLKKTTNVPDIHIIRGGRYLSRQSRNWSALQDSLKHHGAGKGVTEAQAKASALGESLEWYTLGAPANCRLISDSYTKLSANERVLRPEQLVHFSADQIASANQARAQDEQFSSDTPETLDSDVVIDWRPVWSLTKQDWVYVPAAYCGWVSSSPYIPSDSNGAASGVTREHAILHGFNEVIERDAIALWWYNRVSRPSVSLDDLDPRFVASMQNYHHSLGREFWLLDITSDFEIPTFVGVSIDKTGNGAVGKGYGTHRDPHTAATRALTELNQLMPVRGQFIPRSDRPAPMKPDVVTSVDTHLQPDLNQPASRLEQFPRGYRNDIGDDIAAALERTHSMGLEVLVADLTQPDVQMPVVKVIVPGARRAYREFAPGRLYDVPVQLGWCDNPSTESEMAVMPSPM